MTDIIIFSGQSNMQGQSECLLDSGAIDGAYEYKWMTDSVCPLSDPFGENIRFDGTPGEEDPCNGTRAEMDEWLDTHAAGSSSNRCTTLAPKCCAAYRKKTGRKVLAVSFAKGSTEIEDWTPDSRAYPVMVGKIRAAIARLKADGDEVGHISLVWLQGESDAVAKKKKAYYKNKITWLKNALKADVGLEKFGIIRIGPFTESEHDFEVMLAQDEICFEDPDFVMLTTVTSELSSQPEYMNPRARGHYSALGLQHLGEIAGAALAAFTG